MRTWNLKPSPQVKSDYKYEYILGRRTRISAPWVSYDFSTFVASCGTWEPFDKFGLGPFPPTGPSSLSVAYPVLPSLRSFPMPSRSRKFSQRFLMISDGRTLSFSAFWQPVKQKFRKKTWKYFSGLVTKLKKCAKTHVRQSRILKRLA